MTDLNTYGWLFSLANAELDKEQRALDLIKQQSGG